MKKILHAAALVIIIFSIIIAFKPFQAGSITGTVTPAAGARFAWALSPTDTLKAVITKGAFKINNVKAGTYKVMIEAAAPYKDVKKDGIEVADGKATDLGEIKMTK